MLMIALGFWSLWLRFRRRLYDSTRLLQAAVLMGPSGFVAVLAGWITTESGRQPYTVYGLLRTADSASPIDAAAVGASLLAFIVVYFLVFGAGTFYLLRMMAKPPELDEPDIEKGRADPRRRHHAGTCAGTVRGRLGPEAGSGTDVAPLLTTPLASRVMTKKAPWEIAAMLTRRKTLLATGWTRPGIAARRRRRSRAAMSAWSSPPRPAATSTSSAGSYADRLREALGQTWIVENRAGANNTLGAAEVARAAPDGTTLLTNADIHLMARHVMRQVPYDPVADFTPISRLAVSPMVFVGHPGKTPADLEALVAEMKAAPDKHTYSNSGLGSMGHLASAGFNNRIGVKAVIVTYRGTAPALTDVIGGQTTLMVAPLGSALQQVQAGGLARLRGDVRAARPATAVGADGRRGRLPGAQLHALVRAVGTQGHAARPRGASSMPPCRQPPSTPSWSSG